MRGGAAAALLLSMLAGLSTAIGSLFALFSKRTDQKFLSFSLGFSAGVMLLLSFCELLPDARRNLMPALGGRLSGVAAAVSLIAGLGLAEAIDRLVPSPGSPASSPGSRSGGEKALTRVGIVTAVAVTVHNLPEGITTFMAGYADLRLGVPVAIAIALHNIPEGIAVSVPVYYGTGSRGRAFLYSALSGLSEPLGALLAFVVLGPFLNPAMLGVIFGMVSGIMIDISLGGLLPAAQENGRTGAAAAGAFSGMAFMEAAMIFFKI